MDDKVINSIKETNTMLKNIMPAMKERRVDLDNTLSYIQGMIHNQFTKEDVLKFIEKSQETEKRIIDIEHAIYGVSEKTDDGILENYRRTREELKDVAQKSEKKDDELQKEIMNDLKKDIRENEINPMKNDLKENFKNFNSFKNRMYMWYGVVVAIQIIAQLLFMLLSSSNGSLPVQ